MRETAVVWCFDGFCCLLSPSMIGSSSVCVPHTMRPLLFGVDGRADDALLMLTLSCQLKHANKSLKDRARSSGMEKKKKKEREKGKGKEKKKKKNECWEKGVQGRWVTRHFVRVCCACV